MTPSLIRAARGLLNWQQDDLAVAAGLSLSAVNKFERGLGATRAATVQAMVTALRGAGVDFPASGGVRLLADVTGVLRITGKDFVERLDDDIYAAVTTPRQEIYSCSADESQWFAPGIRKTAQRYYAWRDRLGVRQLYLVPEGNQVFESPRENYRFLPPHLLGKIAFITYGDRVALVNWHKKQVFIVRGHEIVAPFREQFKFLWQLGRKTTG
jgi:transcriptional regulator with XRE-family HTH domain